MYSYIAADECAWKMRRNVSDMMDLLTW